MARMMSRISPISSVALRAGRRRGRGWYRRLWLWLRHVQGDGGDRRARRVVLLVILLWMLNLFDLIFTLLAVRLGSFVELNPLARPLLHTPLGLSAFKLAMLTFTSFIFLVCRRRVLTEVGCWVLSVVYTCLGVFWLRYYVALGG